jgi:hypothetical protein
MAQRDICDDQLVGSCDAACLAFVSSNTIALAADRGDLKCQRTAGGRRVYRAGDVRAWAEKRDARKARAAFLRQKGEAA